MLPAQAGMETMMYFDTTIRTHRSLGDAQAIGAMLYRALPDDAPLLWARLDRHNALARTDVQPDVSRIAGVAEHRIAVATLDWPEGTRVRWALIANPTIDLARPGQRSRRVPLTEDDEVTDWASRRLECVEPTDIEVVDMSPVLARRGRATFTRRYVTGAGIVRDSERLGDLMASGVGRGRAAGCGLLRVREA